MFRELISGQVSALLRAAESRYNILCYRTGSRAKVGQQGLKGRVLLNLNSNGDISLPRDMVVEHIQTTLDILQQLHRQIGAHTKTKAANGP